MPYHFLARCLNVKQYWCSFTKVFNTTYVENSTLVLMEVHYYYFHFWIFIFLRHGIQPKINLIPLDWNVAFLEFSLLPFKNINFIISKFIPDGSICFWSFWCFCFSFRIKIIFSKQSTGLTYLVLLIFSLYSYS